MRVAAELLHNVGQQSDAAARWVEINAETFRREYAIQVLLARANSDVIHAAGPLERADEPVCAALHDQIGAADQERL